MRLYPPFIKNKIKKSFLCTLGFTKVEYKILGSKHSRQILESSIETVKKELIRIENEPGLESIVICIKSIILFNFTSQRYGYKEIKLFPCRKNIW